MDMIMSCKWWIFSINIIENRTDLFPSYEYNQKWNFAFPSYEYNSWVLGVFPAMNKINSGKGACFGESENSGLDCVGSPDWTVQVIRTARSQIGGQECARVI